MDERELITENPDSERDAVWAAYTQATTTLEFREADDASRPATGRLDPADDALAA